ncbi:glycoside hydrolase family 76 protein [Hydnomerulius pinastri MD-312]|uniref:Glycoside hydrolase family 76 protein n=1 Tax=Hydnomerulius pinastri MD-312 TaxID=994086 RepID=A0A0C9VUP4_9AGAM|nr:glycoside hydrolase family 76 protein [Hydnomerulius pinastri MD-312]
MSWIKALTPVALLALTIPSYGGPTTYPPAPLLVCPSTTKTAFAIGDRLISKWYNATLGQMFDGDFWVDCNTWEDFHNLMLDTHSTRYESLTTGSYLAKAALDPTTDWAAFLGGSNDDSLWAVLSLWKMADYRKWRREDPSAWLNAAATIWDLIAHEWDDTCGGGVWWSTAHTYKNSITNELFLLTSAEGYLRNGNNTYLDFAEKEWDWLYNSGMRNSEGLFNDGLDLATCTNNNQTAWSYNQAVVASGLGALYVATGSKNTTLLEQAQISIDATLKAGSGLIDNGVLRESCDDATLGGSICNHDQQLFKGLFTKHLSYLVSYASTPFPTPQSISIALKYKPFFTAQYTAITHNALNSTDDVGGVWYAPAGGNEAWQPEASAAGLEGVIAAAGYGKC